MTEELTDAELQFLQAAFELARNGDTADLMQQIDAGLPANLTNRGADAARINDKGQTALAAAVFRQSHESVTAPPSSSCRR